MELLPREQIAFQRMLDTIRRNYERFGFLPVETPVFELSETLLTKSGGETERQVYFVQSTGALAKEGEGLPELALRFDLTVPLARYVAEHEHELTFPFRRYQIQRVYRGERQQRGRFREFYQCDIDVIGKDALSVRFDAEILAVIHAVFSDLGIGDFTIQLNNRKLMRGFFEAQGVTDGEQQALVLREVDKLDKRGADYVRETLTGEDFGTGYSSLNYLNTLPLDKIKIDKSFVRELGNDDADPSIIKAIIQLAHSLNIEVIAEGVENRAQEACLIAQGCSEGQGFLYSRPLPAAQIVHYIRHFEQRRKAQPSDLPARG